MLLVFFIMTANAYSQKRDCKGRYFDTLRSRIAYTDSSMINGSTVYTDSLIEVDIIITYNDDTVGAVIKGFISDAGSRAFDRIHYPITLSDNPPFKEAIFRDYCEFLHRLDFMDVMLYRQERKNLPNEEKGYYIISSDDKYINYAFLSRDDGELHTKYNPITGDNNESSFSFSQRQYGKFIKHVQHELNKGLIVSFGRKNKKTYVVKTFSSI